MGPSAAVVCTFCEGGMRADGHVRRGRFGPAHSARAVWGRFGPAHSARAVWAGTFGTGGFARSVLDGTLKIVACARLSPLARVDDTASFGVLVV